MANIHLTPAFEYLRYFITDRPGYLLKPPRPIPSNVSCHSTPKDSELP